MSWIRKSFSNAWIYDSKVSLDMASEAETTSCKMLLVFANVEMFLE